MVGSVVTPCYNSISRTACSLRIYGSATWTPSSARNPSSNLPRHCAGQRSIVALQLIGSRWVEPEWTGGGCHMQKETKKKNKKSPDDVTTTDLHRTPFLLLSISLNDTWTGLPMGRSTANPRLLPGLNALFERTAASISPAERRRERSVQ